MAIRRSKTYTPQELREAIGVLHKNPYHCFSENDAGGIVKALYNLGYKIVYTGDRTDGRNEDRTRVGLPRVGL